MRFYGNIVVYIGFLKGCKEKSIFLATVIYMIIAQAVGAKENDSYPIEAVKFYPYKNITINPTSSYVIGAITDLLLTGKDSKISNLTYSEPESSSDYRLNIDYAVGCGAYNPQKNCRIMFLWTIMRADDAPVSGWRADYPVTISDFQAQSRFYYFVPPRETLEHAAKDFKQELMRLVDKNSGENVLQTKRTENRNKGPQAQRRKTAEVQTSTKSLYVMADKATDKKAVCSVAGSHMMLTQNGIKITKNKKQADYILETKTSLEDAGGGFMGIRIERKLFNNKTGKGILIPQETAMPKAYFQKYGMNCKSAIQTAIPQIKAFMK